MAEPGTPDGAAPNASCPRCGAGFHCGAREASCGCAEVRLEAAALAALRAQFSGCLCPACLRQAAGGGGRGDA